MASRKK